MLEEDQRRLQRESDIARAVRGPDYSQRDEALRKVRTENIARIQSSNEAYTRLVAGFWEQVSRGEVGYTSDGMLQCGPPTR